MRDKEQTKRKLIDAVAAVFKKESHTGLGVNKVARVARVDKKLIYRYFGSFDNLIEEYVKETDYWLRFMKHFQDLGVKQDATGIQEMIREILKNQFLYFYGDVEMQNLMLWELNAKTNLMRSIHRTRELMGQQILEMTDPFLTNNKVNFRAVAALLVGGKYYTILHTRNNGGMFSDVDLSSEKGRNDILTAITFMVDSSFTDEKPVAVEHG